MMDIFTDNMKKIIFTNILLISFLSFNYSYSQDYQTFSDKLSNLKSSLKSAYNNCITTNELEDKISSVNSEVHSLRSDVEDYIKDNNLSTDKKFKNLYTEIKEFDSFVSFNQPSCVCLKYFSKFLSELGASTKILKKLDSLSINIATIGNFNLYYVIPKYFLLYTLDVNMKNVSDNRTCWDKFGLLGDVKGFNIEEKKEIYYITGVTFKIIKDYDIEEEYKFCDCKEEFPRN